MEEETHRPWREEGKRRMGREHVPPRFLFPGSCQQEADHVNLPSAHLRPRALRPNKRPATRSALQHVLLNAPSSSLCLPSLKDHG